MTVLASRMTALASHMTVLASRMTVLADSGVGAKLVLGPEMAAGRSAKRRQGADPPALPYHSLPR
jgi:hypothetical protein